MSAVNRQFGFTLVELMVALVIGLFLTAGMIQVYVSNKHTFRFSESISRIQENGRYAVDFIARDMRMADFWGCNRGENLTDHLDGWCGATPTEGIVGQDGSPGAPGSPDLPDTITLRGAVRAGLTVAGHTPPLSTTVSVEGTKGNAEGLLGKTTNNTGDIALISSCSSADLFQVTSITGGSPAVLAFATGTGTPPGPPGNATDALSNEYDETATVLAWREVIYTVADPDGAGPRQSVLQIQENACAGGAIQEVVEGVENMQIAYGEDVDGDGSADSYVRATSVSDWENVVSVRMSLLLASPAGEESVSEDIQTIILDDFDGNPSDDTYVATDNRLYQVVTATFAIRNRIP